MFLSVTAILLILCTHSGLSSVQSKKCPIHKSMNGLLSLKGSQIGVPFFRERFSGAMTTTGLTSVAMNFARDTSLIGYRRGELHPESGT